MSRQRLFGPPSASDGWRVEKIAEEGGAEFKLIYHARTVASGDTVTVTRRSNGGTENEGLGATAPELWGCIPSGEARKGSLLP